MTSSTSKSKTGGAATRTQPQPKTQAAPATSAPATPVKESGSTAEAAHETAATATVETVSAVKSANDAVESAAAESVARMEQAVASAEAEVARWQRGAQDQFEDFAGMQRASFEALIRAQTSLLAGVEEMSKSLLDFAHTLGEDGLKSGRAMLEARSLRDMVELNNDFARKQVEYFLTEGSKLSELGVRTASESVSPIQERVRAVLEHVQNNQKTAA